MSKQRLPKHTVMTRAEFMAEADQAETIVKRKWFHLGEIMPKGAWLAIVTFANGNETVRPCATRGEARAYTRMQRAYGDVKTAVRRA